MNKSVVGHDYVTGIFYDRRYVCPDIILYPGRIELNTEIAVHTKFKKHLTFIHYYGNI